MWSTPTDRERAERAAAERRRLAAILDTGDRVLTLRIVYNPAQMERDSEFVQDRRANDGDTHADILVGDILATLDGDNIAYEYTQLSDLPVD